jgi:2-C-methyl-D-erythritol 4-phosphate cytidylyltransferase
MDINSTSSCPRHFALIPAAGVGARMGTTTPKQYMQIAGKPMMAHVLETFAATPAVSHTFVVVSADDGYINDLMQTLPSAVIQRTTILRCGGASRAESVLNGLNAMQQHTDNDWILVHDAARPGITSTLLNKLIATLATDDVGGLLALPVVDTLKHATDTRVDHTVPRAQLWAAQTPQMFRYGVLLTALTQAQHHIEAITDDASAVEMLGLAPKLVEGSPRNFKVTLPHDVALAEFLLLKNEG